ncbi:hypothetical protein V8G54_010460 [Vigna mungo]|uniref:Ubiquitin-like protease family profile domain-containing protein n=1 Tax=Vigna mungo TaxID=3915 RepID=A0AAQ3S5T3_VIGMU
MVGHALVVASIALQTIVNRFHPTTLKSLGKTIFVFHSSKKRSRHQETLSLIHEVSEKRSLSKTQRSLSKTVCLKNVSLYPPFEVVGGSLGFWAKSGLLGNRRTDNFRMESLGFGVGGLEEPLDESFVGKLWAYERLGLYAHSSHKVFPRILRFHSLNSDTEEIDALLKRGEVAAVEEKHLNEKHMKELSDLRNLRYFGNVDNQDVEGQGKEDCAGEEVPSEAPVEGAGPTNEAGKDEAAVDEGSANEGATNEAAADEATADDVPADQGSIEASADEGTIDEAPVDEECAGEGHEEATHEEVGHEACEAHEERASEAHEEGATDADEEASAHSHEEGVDDIGDDDEEAFADPPPIIDIGDDDYIGHVQPKVVVPLRTYNGDLKTTVDLDKLNNAVTRRDIGRRYVSEIMGQLLTTTECHSLGRRECVDNMTLMFAATIFMYFEKRSSGVIKRMVFSPNFATHVLIDYKRKPSNQHVWRLVDYQTYFWNELVKVEDLLSADWVFIPVVNSEHWWCYALKVYTFQLFVIDSLEKGIKGRCRIDRTIAQKIKRLWGLMTNPLEDSKCPLIVEQAKIPVQPNTYDCGVIMMKAIEIWDGEEKFDGKSMPDYTNVG